MSPLLMAVIALKTTTDEWRSIAQGPATSPETLHEAIARASMEYRLDDLFREAEIAAGEKP